MFAVRDPLTSHKVAENEVTDCAGYKMWEDSHDTHMVAIIQVKNSFIRTSHIPPEATHAQIVFRRIVEML